MTSEYIDLLKKSFANTQDAISQIEEIQQGSHSVDEPIAHKIDTLQRQLVMENIELVIHKDQIKGEINRLNKLIGDKLNTLGRQQDNIKLIALKRKVLENDEAKADWQKDVNSANRYTKVKVARNASMSQDDIALLDKMEEDSSGYMITDEDMKQFTDIVKGDFDKRFRLAGLDKVGYTKRIDHLNSQIEGWDKKLNALSKFVTEDVAKVQTEIESNTDGSLEKMEVDG